MEKNKDKSFEHLNKEKNLYRSLTFILSLLTIVFAGLFIYQSLEKDDIITEKEKISDDLSVLYKQYEGIKTTNKEINKKLEKEQKKISLLQEEIEDARIRNANTINEYKKQVKTLRKILKSYIVQIDSLNQKNKILIAENKEVKNAYEEVLDNNKNLHEQNKELNEKVEIASVVKAKNIIATPINKRSKLTDVAKRVEKVKTCFYLVENQIVESGKRNVYIRISRPDGYVIVSGASKTFNYQGNNIVYTEKRTVNYENKRLDICIYWKKDQVLIPGNYKVDVFMNSEFIGESSFYIKK